MFQTFCLPFETSLSLLLDTLGRDAEVRSHFGALQSGSVLSFANFAEKEARFDLSAVEEGEDVQAALLNFIAGNTLPLVSSFDVASADIFSLPISGKRQCAFCYRS